jgi:hypothetical protein
MINVRVIQVTSLVYNVPSALLTEMVWPAALLISMKKSTWWRSTSTDLGTRSILSNSTSLGTARPVSFARC